MIGRCASLAIERSLYSLQDAALEGVRFTHWRVRVLQGEVEIPMIGMFHFML